jgi:3',5'-cyclic AMP phosphodiesterase CpdA
MKHLAWATDIHLNFLTSAEVESFCHRIKAAQPDALLLGGDIGEAADVMGYLEMLAARLTLPIYFVLGNHDFYGGSITRVRLAALNVMRDSEWLHYLSACDVVVLTEHTGLLGHDGWGDGRIGDYAGSSVVLNDYYYIAELAGLPRMLRLEKLNALGDEAAAHLQAVLPAALARFCSLVVLTHVPPFKEACWHEGRISDDDWLPHFTCQAVGDVLKETMQAHPNQRMTVLCGHTHGAGEAHILPNLLVKTGGARYGAPALQDMLLVG